MKTVFILAFAIFSQSVVLCKSWRPRSCENFIKDKEGDLLCRGRNTIYSFYGNGRNFFDAEANCVSQGGHLVGIEDEAEADFLLQEMQKRGLTLAWTGLNDHIDNSIDGTFVYLTGIDGFVPSSLPSNSALKDCAALEVGNANKFEVRSCGGTTKIASVCKMNYFRNSIIFVPAIVPQRDDSDGVLTELNWTDADQECKNKGGDMLRIWTPKSLFLTRLLRKRKIESAVWIGMYFDASKNRFLWNNGKVSKYRRWCCDEPSVDRKQTTPAQCVAFVAGEKGSGRGCIKVEQCGTADAPNKKMFVCQIKEKPTRNDASMFFLHDALNDVEN